MRIQSFLLVVVLAVTLVGGFAPSGHVAEAAGAACNGFSQSDTKSGGSWSTPIVAIGPVKIEQNDELTITLDLSANNGAAKIRWLASLNSTEQNANITTIVSGTYNTVGDAYVHYTGYQDGKITVTCTPAPTGGSGNTGGQSAADLFCADVDGKSADFTSTKAAAGTETLTIKVKTADAKYKFEGSETTLSVAGSPHTVSAVAGKKFTLTKGSSGTAEVLACTPGGGSSSSSSSSSGLDPAGDADDDGAPNGADNCPTMGNPDQADTFGGPDGDVCDNNFYHTGFGPVIYQQKDGSFTLYGNCDAEKCQAVANFNPALFDIPEVGMGADRDESRFQLFDLGSGWTVKVFLLDVDEDGTKTYQVNFYDEANFLIRDSLEIYVTADGSVSWHVRS